MHAAQFIVSERVGHQTLGKNRTPDDKRSSAHGAGRLEQIGLWKMDPKRAFTLLFVDPEFVQRLAFELTDELTILYITGMFGYTGMPGAFQG